MASGDPRLNLEVQPHHEQRRICASRAKYREGRKPRAVKVYTVNLESRYLLVQGVPAIGLMKELVEQFALYGAIEEYNVLDEYPTEEFAEVFLLKFQRLQSARVAKRKQDERSFFGGLLHVCYAPEFETVQETREKLQQRRRYVARATSDKDHQVASRRPEESKSSTSTSVHSTVNRACASSCHSSVQSGDPPAPPPWVTPDCRHVNYPPPPSLTPDYRRENYPPPPSLTPDYRRENYPPPSSLTPNCRHENYPPPPSLTGNYKHENYPPPPSLIPDYRHENYPPPPSLTLDFRHENYPPPTSMTPDYIHKYYPSPPSVTSDHRHNYPPPPSMTPAHRQDCCPPLHSSAGDGSLGCAGHTGRTIGPAQGPPIIASSARFMPRTTQLQERQRRREEETKLTLILPESQEIIIGPKLPEIPKLDLADDSLNLSADIIRARLKEVSASCMTAEPPNGDSPTAPPVKHRRRI